MVLVGFFPWAVALASIIRFYGFDFIPLSITPYHLLDQYSAVILYDVASICCSYDEKIYFGILWYLLDCEYAVFHILLPLYAASICCLGISKHPRAVKIVENVGLEILLIVNFLSFVSMLPVYFLNRGFILYFLVSLPTHFMHEL